MRTILDIAGLQLAWWACALGAASGMWWPGTGVALAVVALQLGLSGDRRALVATIVAAGAIGVVGETLLVAAALVRFSTPSPALLAAPVWLVALWLSFATCIGPMRRGLGGGAMAKAALLGAVGGPPTYWAAQRLGALELVAPTWSALMAIGLLWAFAMMLLIAVDKRYAGT